MPSSDAVIEIALAEVGYLEKSARSYKADPRVLADKIAGAGYDNITKYGKEMHEIYPQTMDFPAAWCDAFVDWCFYKAYGVSTAKSLLRGNFDDYTVASAQMFKKHSALDKTPRVGDQIFFSKSNTIGSIYHTGIVYAVDSTTIYTIEGNTSSASAVVANGGAVRMKSYIRTSTAITRAFFGHPRYDAKATIKPSTYDVAHGFEKSFGKVWTVTASELNVRSGAGTDKAVLGAVPKGVNAICYGYYNLDKSGNIWLLVVAGGMTGYVSKRYLV